MSIQQSLSIGRLAAAAGVSVEAIRHYERIRLMPPPGRSRGGHRQYGAEHHQRLGFIRRAVDLGFGLDEVGALLALSAPEDQNCAQARAMAAGRLADVRAKIADLRRLEDVLDEAVSRCDAGTFPPCAVIETLTHAA